MLRHKIPLTNLVFHKIQSNVALKIDYWRNIIQEIPGNKLMQCENELNTCFYNIYDA